jgi:hypothetical protein
MHAGMGCTIEDACFHNSADMPLRRSTVVASAFLILTACGGGGTQPPEPSPAVGSLLIGIDGLPYDVRAFMFVTGPGGFKQTFLSQRIDSLPPGEYTVTPSIAQDRSIFYTSPPRAVSVRAGAVATTTAVFALKVPPRSRTIRPGTISLAERMQLLYLVPSDGVDRGLDTSGVIHRSVSSGQRWLAAQTAGRWIRHDLNSEALLDVTFVRLAHTEATYYAYGAAIRDSLEKELIGVGLTLPNLSLLAYYEGRSTTGCSASAWPPAVRGTLAVLFLNGLAGTATPCSAHTFAGSTIANPDYWEFATQRELLHLMGIVASPARDFVAGGYVGNDPADLMYAGPLPWRPATVDAPKSNYYNENGLPLGVTNFIYSGLVVTR